MRFNHSIYQMLSSLGGHRIARFLARGHPRILMYHRITEYPEKGAIDQETFRSHMRLIRRHFNLVSLPQLIDMHEKGRPISHAISVTFDDGYHDFYDFALPILKDENIPATLFLTTGFVDADLWLWPDKLRYCFEATSELQLELPPFHMPLDSLNDRFIAWERIADQCLILGDEEKHAFIKNVADALGVTLPFKPPERFAGLNWDQVRAAAAAGVQLGSHTVSHPILTRLTGEALAGELTESKERIETETGQTVTAFCYPNGQPFDFNQATKRAIKKAGYSCAITAFPGQNPLQDRWAINRYPASSSQPIFEKMVFGFSYIGLKARRAQK